MCAGSLRVDGGALRCDAGHAFDLARQGYVSLLTGRGSAHRSDTAAMVAARHRVVGGGLYAPIVDAVAECAAEAVGRRGVIVDAGGGPGHYLAAALDAAGPDTAGLGVDLSKYCARSAARIHPRAVAAVADLWAGLPVRDGAAAAVLSVFAPRNAVETARVLAPGGTWIVVTPEPGHLAEIVEPMGMLTVGAHKADRLADEFAADFAAPRIRRVRAEIRCDTDALVDIAAMGPAAFHRDPAELRSAAAQLSDTGPVTATLDVTVTVARRS
ncbi:putative RNA methyltransferase [Gordonia shandongensis]|uniref:putative RNA methyltransferase n=1 Tax=Gordonia shandongensis TaxID=376351 RepID=UPI000404669A|nr:methyltransferase [Gordonia shandongensis]